MKENSDGYGKRTYNIRFEGYYYCGSENTGHQPHAWNTSSWSGNGASGSTLEWDSIIGSAWAANPQYSSNYCLLASNTHLYHNSTLLFQTCANAIKYTITDYRVDGEDVRERGALGYYKCPDTFGTPAPASNWMILNAHSCLLMDVDDGQYTGYGAAWSGVYVVWFDSISVENIGAVFSNSDEEFYVATVTNGHYARLCEKSGTWGTLWDIADNQVIGLRNPAISEEHTSGMLGGYYFNGILASSCNIIANGSTFLRYKNNCKICDCESVVAEASMFMLRRSLPTDSIVIDSDNLSVTTDEDTIVIDSSFISILTDGDSLLITIGREPTSFENVTLSYSNPMLYEKSVDSVSALVQGVTYTPARVKHRGNPAFQVGDIVTVPDKDGVYHSVLIMQQTLTFGGGMNSEITSPGQTEQQASFSANGPITTQIKNEVKQSSVELEHRLSVNNSLVFAALQRNIGATEAKISSIVEWQTDKTATISRLVETASEQEASIKAITEWQGETDTSIASIEETVSEQGSEIELRAKTADVEAALELKVGKNEDGEIESEISIATDKLTIHGDDFSLEGGKLKAKDGEFAGKITAGEESTIAGWNIREGTLVSPPVENGYNASYYETTYAEVILSTEGVTWREYGGTTKNEYAKYSSTWDRIAFLVQQSDMMERKLKVLGEDGKPITLTISGGLITNISYS